MWHRIWHGVAGLWWKHCKWPQLQPRDKSEVSERGRRIKTLHWTQRSKVTSIAYFCWRLNYDWVCVHASLCVWVRVSIIKQGTLPLGRHQLSLICNCETFPVTNTESCKTCHWAALQPMHCAFMLWFLMKLPCCWNEFSTLLGMTQLKLRWSKTQQWLWHEYSCRHS